MAVVGADLYTIQSWLQSAPVDTMTKDTIHLRVFVSKAHYIDACCLLKALTVDNRTFQFTEPIHQT